MLAEQAVDAGDADVEQPIDRVAHHLGRDARFLGDRQIGCARRRDEDRAAAGLHVALAVRDGPGDGWNAASGTAFCTAANASSVARVTSRVWPRPTISAEMARDLFGRLAQPEHDFGKPLAQLALVIDPREARS